VIEILSKRIAVPISINTSNPEVMQAAVIAGAKMLNDIRALSKVGALGMASKLKVPVCIMHMLNEPGTMQLKPQFDDIVTEVYQFLERRITSCVEAGIEANKIIIDPGFGFGKNLPQNLALLRSLDIFAKLHKPVLVGISNKSMIGQILDVTLEQRVYGNLAASVVAMAKGASIIRAHDVQATSDALKVFKAIAGL
jgi:dihydropteroate synthase